MTDVTAQGLLGAIPTASQGGLLSAPAPVASPLPTVARKPKLFRGQIVAGNIDLGARPVVKNPDGTISTVRSMSFSPDGQHEFLIPTVSDDGRIMANDEAVQAFYTTGKHLGIFNSPDAATAYAKRLHNDQARMYGGRK